MTVSLAAQAVASQLIERYGQEWNRSVAEACVAAYLSLHTSELEPGLQVKREIAYGPHPRQKLDVYRPAQARAAPVLIFFHGGGLNSGDKQLPGSQGRIYANVGRYFARHGAVALIASYRLVPDAKYPDGGEDVRLAVQWARHEIERHGGDPERISLLGNSAGGVHVATYLFRNWQAGEIERAILYSVPCTMPAGGPREPVTSAYYGPAASERAQHYPLGLLGHYVGPQPPMLFLTAEFDPAEILEPGQEFTAEFTRKFGDLQQGVILHHNHISGVLSLNTGDETLGRVLLETLGIQ